MLTIADVPTPTSSLSPDALVPLEGLDRTHIAIAGGKGAQLGELTWIDGVSVPAGFVVTTAAYRRALRTLPDHSRRSGEPAGAIAVPDDVAATIRHALARLGDDTAVAVRSSATAEDLPSASAAGQHDTFLGVVGADAVIEAVSRCWASLFTDRAVTYRQQHGVDDRDVAMAVVVQKMVDADVSGVMFTADPITSNRTVAVVEAVLGSGDALVSGTVDADSYRVRKGAVVDSTIAGDRRQSVLSETEVLELVAIGRRIESHFGSPQDIEWCLADGAFHVVQSRAITTLFPVPPVDDDRLHVYLSVGHQQMMTDAMSPLGLSLYRRLALRPMHEAGGRLFVDVTDQLATTTGRATILGMLGRSDPLVRDALHTLIERGDVAPPTDEPTSSPGSSTQAAPPAIATDPAIPAALVRRNRESVEQLQRDISSRTGVALFDFIDSDLEEMRRLLADPEGAQVIMAGITAAWWLNDHVEEWLGEANVADTLSLSVPDNVSSEMGLALLDVADVIRQHAAVVEHLETATGEHVLEGIASLPGGAESLDAITTYLDRFGMRGPGEIDIARPRWAERPDMLVPVILGHVRSQQPGAGRRRFDAGRAEAATKERAILERLQALPDGTQKVAEAKANIDRLRTFAGYREYPKYGWVSRYLVYKRALLAEAERLVAAGVTEAADDCFFLTLDEFRDAVATGTVDDLLIRRRRAEHRAFERLTPPRVLTSDGEALNGSFRRDDAPSGVLVGLAAASGVVEGRARVVIDMAQARLEPGDILVTTHTDPSWSPLFVSAAGVVTEVGGLTTHGAVVAREYGLPAVVSVPHATRLIGDGQRIRVNGTDGIVELLAE